MDIKKDLNVMCVCDKLYSRAIKIVMLLPCEHMMHSKCVKKHKMEFCPICKEEIASTRCLTDEIMTIKDSQRYSDI